MSSIKLRPGTFDDYAVLVQWAVSEFQWELCTSDYHIYNKCLQPGWFWVAENECQETLGYIGAAEHGPDDGYLGLLFIRKDHRRSGIGKLLLENAQKILDGRNIALATEPHLIDLYARYGFKVFPDYAFAVAEGYATQAILSKNHNVAGVLLEEPSDQAIDQLIRYDSDISGRNRASWCTQHFLNNPYAKSLVAFNGDQKSICGFGTIKDIGSQKLRIGPIYADSEAIATVITFGLISKFMSKGDQQYKLRMFCMLPNKDMSRNAIVEELGLEITCEMTHMFTHRVVKIDKDRVFCLADCDINVV